jgi:hypothetical protein
MEIISLIIFSFTLNGKDYIKEGGESLSPNEFVKIKIENSRYSDNLNIYYWDFTKGTWIEESENKLWFGAHPKNGISGKSIENSDNKPVKTKFKIELYKSEDPENDAIFE